jgi:hypothetical protein
MFLAHDAHTSSPPLHRQSLVTTHIHIRRSPGVVVGSNKGAHAHCTDTRTASSQRALASQHNTLFETRLTCTDTRTRHGVLSACAGLAAQYSRRSDASQPYTMPAVYFCSATSRYRFLSTFSVLSMLPLLSLRSPGHSTRARRLFFPRGAFLGAVSLGLLEQTPQHQQAVEAEPPLVLSARSVLVRSTVLLGDILDVPRTRRAYV